MDWIREGRITRMNQEPEEGVKKIEEELKTLSETMADAQLLRSAPTSPPAELKVTTIRRFLFFNFLLHVMILVNYTCTLNYSF